MFNMVPGLGGIRTFLVLMCQCPWRMVGSQLLVPVAFWTERTRLLQCLQQQPLRTNQHYHVTSDLLSLAHQSQVFDGYSLVLCILTTAATSSSRPVFYISCQLW